MPVIFEFFLRPPGGRSSLHTREEHINIINYSLVCREDRPPGGRKKDSVGKWVEVESPSPMRYLMGAIVMMVGVILPVGYLMFRNKRVPSSSTFSKQTNKGLI